MHAASYSQLLVFPFRTGFACSVVPALPLLSLFSLFPLKEKSAKKPMLAGNPCCVAIRQAQQVECAKPLAFPFGQASPVPLCRHTLAFPFFRFSTEGEKREKSYVSGESLLRCHQASATSRVRKASCFPLRESLPNCRFKAISASRVAQGAERGQFKFRPFFQALSLLIFLAKKFAKLSAATRLPLACIKFSATTRLHLLPA